MQTHVHRWFFVLAAPALIAALPAVAQARTYHFTKVADHVQDHFNLDSFTCSSINKRGDVAFKASRTHPNGFDFFDGIYRRNANGTLTTIVEDPDRERFGFIGNSLSLNDKGAVAFGANLATADFVNVIMRGDGHDLTTIASTAGALRFVGFDVSMNKKGEVAFTGSLDPELGGAQGLFSGDGDEVTIHYLASEDVELDEHEARFFGSFNRPSINKHGEIAFQEFLPPSFESGVFVGREGEFSTIAVAPPFDRQFGVPVINDHGTAAFETRFFDENGDFVSAIVKSSGGTPSTVADTDGPFGFFGFRPPAINAKGEVVFSAILDDFATSGIFTGPDPIADKVIATGDALDGATVASFGLHFCEEGVNESGQVAFIALLDDPAAPFGLRSVVFRAEPIQ